MHASMPSSGEVLKAAELISGLLLIEVHVRCEMNDVTCDETTTSLGFYDVTSDLMMSLIIKIANISVISGPIETGPRRLQPSVSRLNINTGFLAP